MSSANETIYIETGEGENEPCWCLECGWDGVENDLAFTNDGIFVCPHCGGEEVDDFYSEDVNSCVFCGSDQVVGTIDIVSLNEMNEASPLDKEQVYGYCARCADVKMAEGSTGDQVVSWEDVAGVSSPSMPPSDIKWAESKICHEDCGWGSGRTSSKDVQCTSQDPTCGLCNFHPVDDWIEFTHKCINGHPVCNRCFSGGHTEKDGKIIGDGAGNPCRHCKTYDAETVYRNYQGRKSPALSATSVKRGTRKRGNDGNMWEVRRSGKSQRWFKGAESSSGHTYKELTLENMDKDTIINMIKRSSDLIIFPGDPEDSVNFSEEDFVTVGEIYQSFIDGANISRQRFPQHYKDQKDSEHHKGQGYNDKMDESLGERNVTFGEQSLKDRRDEAAVMDKKHTALHRKYDDVSTMDSSRTSWRSGMVLDAEEVPVVPDPSSFPQGDGRVLGQQTNQANLSPLHAEDEDVQMVKIQDPVITGAKMALGVVALNATAIAGAALIGLAIAHTARREV